MCEMSAVNGGKFSDGEGNLTSEASGKCLTVVSLEYALSKWQMRNAFKISTAWWATMVPSVADQGSCECMFC